MDKKLIVGLVVMALVVAMGAFWISRGGGKPFAPAPTFSPAGSVDPNALQGMNSGPEPWPIELDHLKDRLTAIGLPALTTEGTVLHIHQHIDMFINGKKISIPADIGVNDAAKYMAPVHTHDTTAIIHVESPVAATFTLGQFFDTWGVRFTQDCLGGYCNDNGKKLQVFSNGKEITGSFRGLPLEAYQEIVVAYGASSELPSPIPSSYAFPPNL